MGKTRDLPEDYARDMRKMSHSRFVTELIDYPPVADDSRLYEEAAVRMTKLLATINHAKAILQVISRANMTDAEFKEYWERWDKTHGNS